MLSFLGHRTSLKHTTNDDNGINNNNNNNNNDDDDDDVINISGENFNMILKSNPGPLAV